MSYNIHTRRKSSWVVILVKIKHRFVYEVAGNWPFFRILPLCLYNSIGGCISKPGHLDTPVMLRVNLAWVDQRAHGTHRPFQFTYSSQHLRVLQLRTRRTLVSYSNRFPTSFSFRSLNGSLSIHSVHFLPGLELERSMLIASLWDTPIITLCHGSTYRLFLCSTGT